jgi:hydrogenase maturation protease
VTVLVGGVGEVFQGDLDLGRVAVDRLAAEDLGRDVAVEELHYGAVAVVQRLEDLRPELLVLVGAARRGRPPGTVERRRIRALDLDVETVQAAVHDAATGYVTIDLVVEVGSGFGALPERTVAIEVEPAHVGPLAELSPTAQAGLEVALGLVRAEVRRAPLLSVAAQLRDILATGRLERAPAVTAMEELLAELELLDSDGRWGRAFALRELVRHRIAAGSTPDGMEHLDWALWWTLLEELDRLQPVEAVRE